MAVSAAQMPAVRSIGAAKAVLKDGMARRFRCDRCQRRKFVLKIVRMHELSPAPALDLLEGQTR